jgi:N-methylhydantoinase A/oxoprolinase/acetone carboxylase beta subunit
MACVFGMSRLMREFHTSNIISVDIGGTTTEIGLLIEGEIKYSEPSAFGLSVDLRRPLVSTLGMGGGSLVHRASVLQVRWN